MSARQHNPGKRPLWSISWAGCQHPELFVGTLDEVVAYMNRREIATGLVHAAREVK